MILRYYHDYDYATIARILDTTSTNVGAMLSRALDRLKDVLSTHPGMTEVHLRVLMRDKTMVMRLPDHHRVTPSPALFADLKQLLGPGCLTG